MPLFGKEKNLAQQLDEQTARVAELEGELGLARQETADAVARAGELDARVAQLEHDLAAAQEAERNAAAAQVAEGERATAAEAEVKELKAKLANPPEAYQHASEGRAAVAAGSGSAEGQQMTWAQAVADCNGSYSKARRKHPDVYAAFMAESAKH